MCGGRTGSLASVLPQPGFQNPIAPASGERKFSPLLSLCPSMVNRLIQGVNRTGMGPMYQYAPCGKYGVKVGVRMSHGVGLGGPL